MIKKKFFTSETLCKSVPCFCLFMVSFLFVCLSNYLMIFSFLFAIDKKTKRELNKLSTIKYQFCQSTSLFVFPEFLLASSTVSSCYCVYAPFLLSCVFFGFFYSFNFVTKKHVGQSTARPVELKMPKIISPDALRNIS